MSIKVDISLQRADFALQIQREFKNTGLTGVFGPSGCGKTSLLRCIAGLEQPHGEISVNKQVWQRSSSNTWLAPAKRNIAYLFQEARLLPHLNIEDNIRLNLKLRKVHKSDLDITRVIDDCGLSRLRSQRPDTLSGGQRQRACLARAIVCEPDLILMDEPLSALDATSKRQMLRLIQRFKSSSSTPIFYVSHSIDEIAQLADDILLMQQGEAAYLGPALQTFAEHSALFDQEQLASVFEATITEIDQENSLSKAEIKGSQTGAPIAVWIGEQALSEGQKIRLRVTARDVSISRFPNTEQSILNVLPARIKNIKHTSESHSVRIKLAIGDNTLHALITKRSLKKLNLKIDQEVWAQVKALSIFD